MRVLRATIGMLALLAVLGVDPLGPCAAAEESEALTKRRTRLEERARTWLQARSALFYRSGRRVRVSRKTFFRLYYDLNSPAWRARQGAPETLEPTWRAMNDGKGRPRAVTRFAVVGATLVADRFGVARYKMNGLDAVREVRWVWVAEAREGRGEWFLYGGDVDGAWGVALCDPAPASRRPLAKADADTLGAALRGLALKHGVVGLAAAGEADIVVVLHVGGGLKPADRQRAIQADAVAVLRAVMEGDARWTGIRLAFLADWIDRFGKIERRPLVHACMDRATYARIVFENLTAEQVYGLLHSASLEHEGWSVLTP